MKTLLTLALSLLVCHLTFAQAVKKGILFELNGQFNSAIEAQSETILRNKNISSDLGVINISDLKAYINNDNTGFEQLLLTFNFESNNLYLTLRFANRSTLQVGSSAFSSLNNSQNKFDPNHSKEFINRKDGLSKSNGFVLEKSAVVSMLEKMNTKTNRIKLKAIHTKNSAQESFLNVLFISTPTPETTFSTFNVEAGMMEPEDNTGCPPFNCQ
jgi:hypothetical protein